MFVTDSQPHAPSAQAASALRAARVARGWSQADAARELAALGPARDVPVAAAASLKTLLSRWENGHAVPEPQYRALLAELLARTPAELGFTEPATASGPAGLRGAIAAAAAVDTAALGLWQEQLSVARRLDDELGVAGAGGVVRAQVEQLERTLLHTLTPAARLPVAAVLAAAAALAGQQALDTSDHEEAWSLFSRSHAVATGAGLPVATAEAVSGLAAVLVDAGEQDAALTLLTAHPPDGPAAARVRWEVAVGQAQAAAGAVAAAQAAFTAAAGALPSLTIDAVEPHALHIEVADLQRWHGGALAVLGDAAAAEPLQEALATPPASARHRATLHADLAAALQSHRPDMAADHRRAARDLARRIGSTRIASRVGGGA